MKMESHAKVPCKLSIVIPVYNGAKYVRTCLEMIERQTLQDWEAIFVDNGDYQRQRELVKPGLTCYWQVSGRNDVMFNEWIEMDLRYIREQSIWTDIRILAKTVGAVFTGKGAE